MRLLALCSTLILLFCYGAASSAPLLPSTRTPTADPAVTLTVKSNLRTTDLNDELLQEYRRQAQVYRSANRLELARQYFEMALAACNTEHEKALVRQELAVVTALIKLRR